MKRIIIPTVGYNISVEDGWSELQHKMYPSKGFFCWKEATIRVEFDKGVSPNEGRIVKYEKIIFEAFSFIEFVGWNHNFSVIEEQIIERKEITEDEYMSHGVKEFF